MELCSDYYDNQGMIKSLTATERQAILAANDKFARDGLRVLAVAHRTSRIVTYWRRPGTCRPWRTHGLSRFSCHE